MASPGTTAEEALTNLGEALERHVDPSTASVIPDLRSVEVEVDTGMVPPVGRLPILSTR
ncbi:MAG: antitoxin HicB [Chloroflexota bacterium]|nr:antitoxin HicB [Chloroflexota bacterium]